MSASVYTSIVTQMYVLHESLFPNGNGSILRLSVHYGRAVMSSQLPKQEVSLWKAANAFSHCLSLLSVSFISSVSVAADTVQRGGTADQCLLLHLFIHSLVSPFCDILTLLTGLRQNLKRWCIAGTPAFSKSCWLAQVKCDNYRSRQGDIIRRGQNVYLPCFFV